MENIPERLFFPKFSEHYQDNGALLFYLVLSSYYLLRCKPLICGCIKTKRNSICNKDKKSVHRKKHNHFALQNITFPKAHQHKTHPTQRNIHNEDNLRLPEEYHLRTVCCTAMLVINFLKKCADNFIQLTCFSCFRIR